MKNLSWTLFLITFFAISCKRSEKIIVDPAFSSYIAAYTSGIVASDSRITIVLASEVKDTSIRELFTFSPDINGTISWLDNRTISFLPEESLKSGKLYSATFALDKVLKVPGEFKEFKFQFKIVPLNFEVKFNGMRPYDNNKLEHQQISGELLTSDRISGESIESILTASQNGKKLPIRWEHSHNNYHYFFVDSVVRNEQSGLVEITWDGTDHEIDVKGSRKMKIPALGEFVILDVMLKHQPSTYLSIQFSDPLKTDQNLEGLITISNASLKFEVSGNEIKAYPSITLNGTQQLVVFTGILNSGGFKFPETKTVEVLFELVKPAIKLTGNGVIVPSTGRTLNFPFEAVNLKSVDVEIVKIFEKNITQFFQVNQIEGNNELRRVGRSEFSKKVDLLSDKPIDQGKWNSFNLDLSKYITVDPGCIYQVILNFRKEYSLYPCGDNVNNESLLESTENDQDNNWESNEANENSYWDYSDEAYESYKWNERDNPCHISYYHQYAGRSVSRNIFGSDIGIIAKGRDENTYRFAIASLQTTEPMSGVELEVYNFQNQLMGNVQTNSTGFADISVDEIPYLVIAKKGKQRGFLRMDNGSSLPLSRFEVGGAAVKKGIKGFIYEERGVRRPGDSLYLSFILEDKNLILPAGHPVIFELRNPRNQVVTKIVKSENLNGFYDFRTKTEPDAITGSYQATIKAGGSVFTSTVRVETVKPNRLKIETGFGPDGIIKNNEQVVLRSKWLHGAPASGLKADMHLTLGKTTTSFKKYPDFIFDDPSREFFAEEEKIFEGTLDQKGETDVLLKFNVPEQAPGMLAASIKTRVFEGTGDYSVDKFNLKYSPFSSYVGLLVPEGDKARNMLLTDTIHNIRIICVDDAGKPVNRESVEIEIYKLEWRWWWEAGGGDNLSRYVNSYSNNIYKKENLILKNGEGIYKMNIKYPEWGRFLIRVIDPVSKHASGKTFYIDWPGWAGRSKAKDPQAASILNFQTDKEKYNVGEKVSLSIPSSEGGRMLVSIESGSKIRKMEWVKTTKAFTKFEFIAGPEMAPNIFVHITMLQPHAQTLNDLPIRMYGVIPVFVEDPKTHLQPVITMPASLRPEEPVHITIHEQQGKEMTYTLAMVDEGLLDLTRFKTPDPWQKFYEKEALGIMTWDLYDQVMNATPGNFADLLAIGGDEGLNKKGGRKANRFKPVVKFLGPFSLKKGQKQDHKFLMPNYIGSVKVMVVAGNKGSYGNAEKAVPVKKPLMILASLPRVLGPSESLKLPITVFAMDKSIKNVSVEIEVSNLIKCEALKKEISFSDQGDKIVNFDISTLDKPGIAKIIVKAKSGEETTREEIEIDIRLSNPVVGEALVGVVEPGKTWTSAYTLPGLQGTNTAFIEISDVPSLNLSEKLRYLIQYPHGCLEQTTSAAFPQLYVMDVMELEKGWKDKIKYNVEQGIRKLQNFQNAKGGFHYWPGTENADDWATTYAGHFLLEASFKGYQVPQGMLDQWKSYQNENAESWSKRALKENYNQGSEYVQAYRLLTLALGGSPSIGAMNRLKESGNLGAQSRFCLAAAYHLAGQPEISQSLLTNVSPHIKDYKELSGTFGSDERDLGMIIYSYCLMGQKIKAKELVDQLCPKLNSDWMSTQTTAFSLIGISKYYQGISKGSMINFTLDQNGTIRKKAVTGVHVSRMDLSTKQNNGNISLSNESKNPLYIKISMEGIPAMDRSENTSNGLVMNVNYKTPSGGAIDPSDISQGADVIVEVEISNPGTKGDLKELALTEIFPSGWEISKLEQSVVMKLSNERKPEYQDFRDDRVLSYFDLPANKSITMRVKVNAAFIGKYYLPSFNCSAMYDHSIQATRKGRWVNVVSGEKSP